MDEDQYVDPEADASAEGDTPDADTAAADLEVRLTFDLGDLRVQVADLMQLQPGFCFELDLPAGAPIRVRSGDQVIATGELVRIDDRLGVMVRSIKTTGHGGAA
jgi:flagellar motor switch/type III secretory pathway protein FliN